jgi:hypothetical protein
MNKINVKLVCKSEEWEEIISLYDLGKEQIEKLFNTYNNEYENGCDVDYQEFLNFKGVKFDIAEKEGYSFEIAL